ncbi:FAZ1 protein, partial [Acromyrmex charruanus]
MEDRYVPPFCSCGCHTPRPIKPIELPPHEPCCCCEYNPFSDNSKESEIYDLPFALRKLTVMKCQMKKWRMERLQLESENRSLKQALQSFGVKPDGVLGTDPLLVHYREENERLQNANEELAEKVCNLGESLAERDCCDDPCEKVKYVREKIAALRDRFAAEKKQMRDTISHLKLKLVEAEEDTSCAALNRLRAKLRELMKDGQKADQQVSVVVERSMQTSVDLSKSYEDLLRTERLQAEPTQIRRSIEEKTAYTEALQSELNKLKASIVIPAVDLDETIVRLATTDEMAEMKEEPEKPDKITELLESLRQSGLSELDVNKLQSEIEDIRSQLYNLKTEKKELLDELKKIRSVVSEKDRQISELNNESEILKKHVESLKSECDELSVKNASLEKEIRKTQELSRVQEEDNEMKSEIDKLNVDLRREEEKFQVAQKELEGMRDDLHSLGAENEFLKETLENAKLETNELKEENVALKNNLDNMIKELESSRSESNNIKTKIDQLLSENKYLRDELEKQVAETDQLKCEGIAWKEGSDKLLQEMDRLKVESDKLKDESAAVKSERDNLTTERNNLKSENGLLKDDLSKINVALDDAKKQLNEFKVENEVLTEELKKANVNNNKLLADFDTLQSEMAKLKSENRKLLQEVDDGKEELTKLLSEIETLKKEVDNMSNKLTGANNEVVDLQQKSVELNNKLKEAQISKLKLDLSAESTAKRDIQEELVALKNEMKNLILKIDEMKVQNHALKEERDILKKELLNLGEESLSLRAANAEMMNQINNLKLDISDLQSQLSKAEEDIKYWKLENCKLKMSSDRLSIENEKTKEALNVCKVEHQTLEKEITNLRNEKIKLEGEIAELKNLAELEKVQKNLDTLELVDDKLNSEVEDLKKTSIDAQNKVNALQYHVAELLEEKEALLKELDSLRAEVSRLGKVVSDKVAKEAIEKKVIDSNGKLIEELKAELDKMRVENESLKRELNDVNKQHVSLKDENAALKIENTKIATELDSFKCRVDNERLTIELAASEARALAIQGERMDDKERQDLQNLMVENKELRDKLRMAQNKINKLKENIKKSKGDFIEDADDIDSFENELIEIDKAREDLKYAAEENNKLKMINDGLELELSRLKALLDEIKDYPEQIDEEVDGTKDQSQRLLAANNALKIKNMELKSGLDHCQAEKEHLNDEINNLSEKIKFLQSLSPIEAGVIKPDECGDFVKANELLKKQIEKQYDAVQRVRDYIQFVDGKIPVKPEMATTLDDDFEIERWIVPSIVELLRESQKLSENIYLAEIEVQNIDRLLKLLNECKKEKENYIKQLLELGVEVTKVAGVDNGDKLAAFDPESWLKSLTLTQLAELHDKICLLTSNMVQDSTVCDCSMINRDYGSDRLRADYDASNRRIAALQKKIAEKQIKAGWKLQELRRTLRIEQANLIQISERIILEKKRNLTFHLTTNDSV